MAKTRKFDFFKTDDPLFKYSVDILLLGLCLLVPGTFFGGITAIYQAVTCMAAAAVCEYIGFKLVLKKNPVGNLSAISTGLIISLLLPSCAPLWVGISASAFAIIVAKLPFGGARNAPFVPAAAGICFVSICFPEQMSTFAAASSGWQAIFSTSENFTTGTTLLNMLEKGTGIDLDIFGITSILSGSYPGAIGTTCVLAMFGVTAYIFIRRPSRLISSMGYILAAAIFAAIFPRTNAGIINSMVTELCAGSLLFIALLIVNDPVTSPKKPLASFVYGVVAGIICMLLRRYAKIDDTGCFSVMIINAIWPVIAKETATDHAPDKRKNSILKKAAKLDKKAAKNNIGETDTVRKDTESVVEDSNSSVISDEEKSSGGDEQ
ncbi:MAG: RnfABCDGE type electron transport complex subunit D [Faecalibacterium sp.]|nr:RnfABCDGE type electron transport complex subunit D [Ruminococcus sp.]MCM1392744.1 RnfABCDGE type electron transport complex subunit D [Ruminococcus sp.]MCM1486300.1 RnfABCDGE type electron transport complex subunit D [Faecalibacterium sp.]